jgi:hypothetical protein
MSTMTQAAPTSAFASAEGILSLLNEDDSQLKVVALRQLDAAVPHHWMEIASALPQMYASNLQILRARLVLIRMHYRPKPTMP